MACTSIQKKTLGVSKHRERMLVQSKDDWGAQVALLQSPILPQPQHDFTAKASIAKSPIDKPNTWNLRFQFQNLGVLHPNLKREDGESLKSKTARED